MAKSCGLKEVCLEIKMIGWDFPFVSQEQKNRFGLHGYVAACVLPDDFKAEHPGAMISENKEADHGLSAGNNFKEKPQENIIGCFEHVYQNDDTTYMDVYIHVDGVTKANTYSTFN